MTPEERNARIKELELELSMLRMQAYAVMDCLPSPELIQACLALKRVGRKVQAVKLYREKMGCGLREAADAVLAMQVERK